MYFRLNRYKTLRIIIGSFAKARRVVKPNNNNFWLQVRIGKNPWILYKLITGNMFISAE